MRFPDESIVDAVERIARAEAAIYADAEHMSFGDGCRTAYLTIVAQITSRRRAEAEKATTEVMLMATRERGCESHPCNDFDLEDASIESPHEDVCRCGWMRAEHVSNAIEGARTMPRPEALAKLRSGVRSTASSADAETEPLPDGACLDCGAVTSHLPSCVTNMSSTQRARLRGDWRGSGPPLQIGSGTQPTNAKRAPATVFDVRSYEAGNQTGGGNQDVPLETRRELMRVAVDRSMSYHYLCAIYRKGCRDGFSAGAETAVIPEEDRAEAIRKAQSSASSYEAGNRFDARLAEDEARYLLRLPPLEPR